MKSVQLIVGANQINRVIPDADARLQEYRQDTGCYYLDYEPITPRSGLLPEDLAVTLLVNSRVGWRAFRSLQLYGSTVDLALLPQKPLEQTSQEERRQVARVIAQIAAWDGLAASVATKILHKKRPDLIPMLDNQAIFGAYLNKKWPQQPASFDSVWSENRIYTALEWIAFDITREENAQTWGILQLIEPSRTVIQLFDSVWWGYFRWIQPVEKRKHG